jgi:hypothetical protein
VSPTGTLTAVPVPVPVPVPETCPCPNVPPWRIRRSGASPVSQHPASAPVGESALDRGEPKAGETGTGTFSGMGTGTGTAALAGGLAD